MKAVTEVKLNSTAEAITSGQSLYAGKLEKSEYPEFLQPQALAPDGNNNYSGVWEIFDWLDVTTGKKHPCARTMMYIAKWKGSREYHVLYKDGTLHFSYRGTVDEAVSMGIVDAWSYVG